MALAEYTVCVATFVCILSWGVEKGMVAGLVLAALSFTVSYAQVRAHTRGIAASCSLNPYSHECFFIFMFCR